MFTNIILIIIGIAVLVLLYFVGSAISLWVQALVSGARVGLLAIVFMRFRKVPPKMVVNAKIMAVKAGLDISTNSLESHFLAGGDVMRVVQALIAADKKIAQAKSEERRAMAFAVEQEMKAKVEELRSKEMMKDKTF